VTIKARFEPAPERTLDTTLLSANQVDAKHELSPNRRMGEMEPIAKSFPKTLMCTDPDDGTAIATELFTTGTEYDKRSVVEENCIATLTAIARPDADPECILQRTLLEDIHNEFSQSDVITEMVGDNIEVP
jgi:hypothetical protein